MDSYSLKNMHVVVNIFVQQLVNGDQVSARRKVRSYAAIYVNVCVYVNCIAVNLSKLFI